MLNAEGQALRFHVLPGSSARRTAQTITDKLVAVAVAITSRGARVVGNEGVDRYRGTSTLSLFKISPHTLEMHTFFQKTDGSSAMQDSLQLENRWVLEIFDKGKGSELAVYVATSLQCRSNERLQYAHESDQCVCRSSSEP